MFSQNHKYMVKSLKKFFKFRGSNLFLLTGVVKGVKINVE